MMRLMELIAELVCRVREDQVAGLGDRQRGLDGLEVAHLADQHHVRVLPEDVLERVLEGRGVGADLALVHDRTSCAVCRYSIGSSMVMMWSRCSELILSMMLASVVLLPEPVGPVTSTRPRGLLAISAQIGRQAQLLEGQDLEGDLAEGAGHRAALHEDVGAEAGDVAQREGEVELVLLLELGALLLGEHLVAELLGVVLASAAAA